jgi:hypothetical protein
VTCRLLKIIATLTAAGVLLVACNPTSPSGLSNKVEVSDACTWLHNGIQAEQAGHTAAAQAELSWALGYAEASRDQTLYVDIDGVVEATNRIQQGPAVGPAAVSECRSHGAWPPG